MEKCKAKALLKQGVWRQSVPISVATFGVRELSLGSAREADNGADINAARV